MAESETSNSIEASSIASSAAGPLVFISHDSRDAELADAFSKLLRSVSAGMIKSFRASDKSGKEGIDFGDEWFKRLMTMLQSTSDVVCLFTERSLERPWILFEAGVAKGKLGTPVVGVALGVPLSRIVTGPFYQFQNMEDSEEDLVKLVNQLAKRVPNLELDADVVRAQVTAFKNSEKDSLKKLSSGGGKGQKEATEDSSVAKLAEEMKALPTRVAERLLDSNESVKRGRFRRLPAVLIEDIILSGLGKGDPIGILVASSFFRDDAPWLYELGLEVYRIAKSNDIKAIRRELDRLEGLWEILVRSPLVDELALGGKEATMIVREFPRLLSLALHRAAEGPRMPITERGNRASHEDRS